MCLLLREGCDLAASASAPNSGVPAHVPGRSLWASILVSQGDQRAEAEETQTQHPEPGPPALHSNFHSGAPRGQGQWVEEWACVLSRFSRVPLFATL